MSYKTAWTKQCVFVCYSGSCTETEVLNAVIELQSDYRFDSTYRALHDFSLCQSMSGAPEYLEELAARNIGAAASNANLKIAVVAKIPDVLAMLKRFEMLALSPYPLRVFETAEHALACWTALRQIGLKARLCRLVLRFDEKNGHRSSVAIFF